MIEYASWKTMLETFPREERKEAKERYFGQKKILEDTFPRGRIVMWEDGRAAVVSRAKQFYGWCICIHGPGKLELLYRGTSMRYLSGIPAELIVRKIPCDEEGIWILQADPRLPDALPWFSRGRQGNASNLRKKPMPEAMTPPETPVSVNGLVPIDS